MQIRLFNPVIHPTAIAAAADVMRSGWIGMGPKVAAFEQAFAAYLGLTNDLSAVATNSCTNALHLALAMLQLPAGAEVITTAMTFVATNQVLLWAGLTPVFADIDPTTGNISPASVALQKTPRTAAVMAVHFAGMPCDLTALRQAAGDLPIIEDCAHACGATYRGMPIGASRNWCAFSFGPTKALTTADGGMLILPAARAAATREYRSLGQSSDIYRRVRAAGGGRFWDYDVNSVGRRYHMNDVNAAIGLAHLPLLETANRRRAEIARLYDESLARITGIRLLRRQAMPPDASAPHARATLSSNYMYVIQAERRDDLAQALQARGITVGVHYKPNTHFALFQRAELPATEAFFARTLTLPNYPEMTDEQVGCVARALKEGW